MSCVEVFASGIKIELSKVLLGSQSRDQGDIQTTKDQQSRVCDCYLTFDP